MPLSSGMDFFKTIIISTVPIVGANIIRPQINVVTKLHTLHSVPQYLSS